ncbi:D-alanyl-D-alanine carboxypeptidase/D-alanyl-D-alanine-endopeptidase [Planctomycetota bacterium]
MASRAIRRVLFSLLAVWCCPPLVGARQAATTSQEVQRLLAKYKQSTFTIHFCDAQTGRTVFAHQSEKPLIPASNMKVITTAAAIDQLGGDFEYKTVVGLLGDNLAVIGSGDPLTGDPVVADRQERDIYYIFQEALKALQKREITELSGDLLIDDFLFDDQRFHSSWLPSEANRWYAAQISAVNFNDNCVDFTLRPGRNAGAFARYDIEPQTSYIQVGNKCRTITSGQQTAWASRQLGTNNITLRGLVRYEHQLSVAIERPSAFLGQVLAEYLRDRDVSIKGKLVIKQLCDPQHRPPENMEVLYTHRTPLSEVLPRANQDSLNMVAECLIKTVGAYYQPNGQGGVGQGSWQSGREAVTAFLQKLNVSPSQFVIDDGSGLSRKNHLSARCLTGVLRYMYAHESYEMFRDSLATPAAGTLKKNGRFKEPKYAGRIYAKTGYISRTWALSGYCRHRQGKWLAFSIIANNGTQSPRGAIDEIVRLIIE